MAARAAPRGPTSVGDGGPVPVKMIAVHLSDGVVTLRPWSREEAPFIVEASTDPAIQRYSAPHDANGDPAPPTSVADTEATIDDFASTWRSGPAAGLSRAAGLAIADVDSGQPLGMCGIDEWSRHGVVQIGYWLAPHARGRGLATRAVVLLTQWLFDQGAARVILSIVSGNESSVATARRAGFVHDGTMRAQALWRGERLDVLWFAAVAGDWTAPPSPGR